MNVKDICPAALGTKDQQPASYDRKIGPVHRADQPRLHDYEPFQVEYTAGQPYVGATLTMYPDAGQPWRHGQLHRLGCGHRQDRVVASPRSSRCGPAR